ncbi:MAG: SDR family oxidoreductase [Kiritimatiellae bacterium]|nr:SDR family oxidoreductase [Kiritimatiellia bacterium]
MNQPPTRTVLVTGAARGIGKVIAHAFVAHGDRVALVDILEKELHETAAELRNGGAPVQPFVADVTDARQVDAMAAGAEAALGPADVLVNCAGTFSYIGPVWEADPDTWFRDTRVNLYGSFLCCRAVVRRMVERGSGCVINVSSTGGHNDPHAYSSSYAVSKVALTRLTEALAIEARPHGIKVFAISPGAILSEMTRFIMDSPGGRKWRPTFKTIFEKGNDKPPEEVARLAVRLADGEADALCGRLISTQQDLDQLVAKTETILKEDLLTLRLKKL